MPENYLSARGGDTVLEDIYTMGSRLTADSAGGSGEVVRAVRKEDGACFAVKVMRTASTREDRSQIEFLKRVNHPGIIKLVDWFETPDMLYVVMELALGGEMFGRITQRGKFSERQAAAAFKQVLEAVGHMHSREIVHCDLKPENILYQDDTDSQIKVADFGFAQYITPAFHGGPGGLPQSRRGTLAYTAPEILLQKTYDTKVDMWSLGVILYILLSGIPPFGRIRQEETHVDVAKRIMTGSWHFYASHFSQVSEPARDLIARLLVVDPAKRLSWDQALDHPWIKDSFARESDFSSAYILELSNFNHRRGMYKFSTHALAGLVSRFGQPDAIAAISSDGSSLSRILQEGSIQPLISLAYSKLPDDRKNACNAMANLALKEEYQRKILQEGGIRRLNQLALKPSAQDVKFFTALALARIAKNRSMRIPLVENLGEDSDSPGTHQALMCLAEITNNSRAQRQAVEALSLLALEPFLHQKLVSAGVLRPLIRQANSSQPTEFRKSSLVALRSILAESAAASGMATPGRGGGGAPGSGQVGVRAGTVPYHAIAQQLDALWSEAAGGDAKLMGGFQSLACMVACCDEVGAWREGGTWQLCAPLELTIPALEGFVWGGVDDAEKESGTEVKCEDEVRQYQQHLWQAHSLLNQASETPHPILQGSWSSGLEGLFDDEPSSASRDDSGFLDSLIDGTGSPLPPTSPQALAAPRTHAEGADDADDLESQLDVMLKTLTQDRGNLLELLLSKKNGASHDHETHKAVLNELTDVIMLISDTLHIHD